MITIAQRDSKSGDSKRARHFPMPTLALADCRLELASRCLARLFAGVSSLAAWLRMACACLATMELWRSTGEGISCCSWPSSKLLLLLSRWSRGATSIGAACASKRARVRLPFELVVAARPKDEAAVCGGVTGGGGGCTSTQAPSSCKSGCTGSRAAGSSGIGRKLSSHRLPCRSWPCRLQATGSQAASTSCSGSAVPLPRSRTQALDSSLATCERSIRTSASCAC
mmetsp:Transcript_100214/g.323307  ORF Transcript_100214/g.323307 Transcript_100214/m.323307 type:complete len:226 (+) Transcript_100214:1260-1937(+)